MEKKNPIQKRVKATCPRCYEDKVYENQIGIEAFVCQECGHKFD